MKTKMKFSKQILSVLLCLAMLISYVPVFSLTASAATVDVWDGTTASQAWDSGSGTEADPYIIMTAAQLAKLAADVNSGTDYSGTYFKLGADLDLGGSDRTWTPIGDATYTFKGNFNGDGKTISNMYAYGKNTNNKTYGYRALFGNITGGTIENFTLASPSSTGAWGYIAAAVAYGSGATVKNIIITNPKVTTQAKSSKGFAGGVVGHIADGVIENCKIVSGTIDSKFKCTGGVVGYATDAQISGCSVKDVTISSTSQYVGGIVGQLQYTDGINSIENCTVENCAISSTSSAVGGVVGYAYGNSAGIITVKRCSVTGGSVTASNYAGGIMGQSFNADIIGCCNYGASVTATSSTGYAGGILGYYNIGNCYSCFSSAVITASKYPGAIIGGDSTYYYECAYDKTLYAQNKTYSNTKGFTTEEIKDGAAAYHLANTGTREKNFHNWGQKIGTDLYPVWNTNNDSSIVVYREEGSNGYIYFNEGTVDVFEPNEDGYYEISDTETWYKFARKAEEDASVKGLVTAAIDFSAISADAIEDYRICADVAFTGTFDGGNKTISGLPETDKPLFGTIGVGGKLLNMTLSGATVTSRYDTAGLVLENNGKVENCTVSNVTVSGSIVSGMIGENNGTISNCTAENVTVSSTSSSAGLVSYNTGTIEDCAVVSGTITADSTSKGNTYDAWAGGICGISIGGKISGCSNGANVIAKSGDNHAAAGIVAAPSKDSSGNSVQVTECFNTGAISSDYYAGGITGFYETSVYVSISLCYNTGNIEGTTVGGIAASGSNNRNDNFINCYNAGQVNGSKAGGIAGSRGNVIIQNCHNYAKVVSTNIGAPIVGMDSGAWPGTGNLINNHAIEGNVEAPTVRSFYDTATATSSSNAVIKGSTKEQFESGEIAYLLQQANGGAAVWSQGESYPVFASDENDKVVKIDFYAVIDEIVHENSYATIYLIPGRVLTEADYPSPSDIDCTLEGCYLDRDCTMAIDRTAFTADTDTKLFVKLITHRHDWTYTKENETTITATCIADGCTAKDGGSVKLVVNDSYYTGNSVDAVVEGTLTNGATYKVTYNGLETAPSAAGTYIVKLTVYENGVEKQSISEEYSINKADQDAPTGIGKADETISAKNDGKITGVESSMEYRKDGESSYKDIEGTEVTDLADGTYFVRYKETDNYNASSETEVTIAVGRKLRVTLPQNQVGYTASTTAENLDWKDDVTITVEIHDGYSKMDGFKILVNGRDLTESHMLDGKTVSLSGVIADITIEIEGVADITAPDAEISIKDNKWNQFWNNITFGLFFKETQDVRITANDKGVGVDAIYYYLADSELELDEVKALTDWQEYNGAFQINPNNRYVIYAKAVDKNGNIAYINSAKGIVLDSIAPVLYGIENGGVYHGDKIFKAVDDNFLKVEVDGVDVTNTTEGDNEYKIVADNAEHTITVTDKAGNVTEFKITVYKRYMVTYTDGEGSSYEKEFNYGEVITIPTNEIFNDTFRRGGYTLIGWQGYTEGMTMPLNPVTLTALYKPNQYSVSFNANGGETIEPITVTFDEKYGNLPSSATAGLSGGSKNWYLVDAYGNVTEINIKNLTLVATARDHTLFIKRSVLAPNISITLAVPGGISDGYQYYIPGASQRVLTATVGNMNTEILDYAYKWYKDGALIEGATSNVLTLDGNVTDSGTYKVEVTATLKDGTNIIVTSDTATASKEQKVKILHATNTLSYDANGGEEGPQSSYTGGATLNVSKDVPTRMYYDFIGWNTAPDGSGDSYKADELYTFAEDKGNGGCVVTLYAQWKLVEYTVTYTADGQIIVTEKVEHGKDATLPAVPAKDGYVGKWDADGKNIAEDTTISVVYTEIPILKPDEVKPEDKTDLEDAKAKLEEELKDDSYTDEDKKDIQDAIDDIDDALEVIGNVEAVEELIDKLPDTIKKDDEAAIKAADDAYNALSDYEKSLVDEDAKKALDDAKAALAELNKPADTDSPQTGDNSNMFLWIALLFISGGAVITLTVVDRKKRMASNR